MIELKRVNKRFNNDYALKNVDLTFPQYGIVVIYGPSGCGKTTLLNVISSLYDFEGDVSFNGKHYSNISEKEKDRLRNTKMGFIFQDYKLFEFETVRNNILLALDIKSSDKTSSKERRVKDLLKIVHLESKENEIVSKLSGGEKQRVAFARAICNSPSVLLADEPTGNLDNKNSELIMELIEKVSNKSLVIMVSHDETLTKKYADQIIYMKDGEVERVEYNNHNHHVDYLPLIHIKPRENEPKLPFKFCISHTFNNIKRRRWRTIFVLLTTSLGLIGVGLGSVLSNIISTNLYKSYSSIIDSTKVILKPKSSDNSKQAITGMSYEEVNEIAKNYKDSVANIGIYYWNNVNSMFTSQVFSLETGDKVKTLPEYNFSHFNEYMNLKTSKNIVRPYQVETIENDEVILGLTYPLLNEICFQLFITRNEESLSKYLKENNLFITMEIQNSYWSYQNVFSLKVKGFSMTSKNCFIHSNPLWNEFIFEEKCGFSSTDILTTTSKNPWDMKKSFYLEFKNKRDEFLTDIRFSREYQYVTAEILNETYYPNLYQGVSPKDCNRVMIVNTKKSGVIDGFYNRYIKNASKHITSMIYGSDYGYAVYPESLMMGFSKPTYLSDKLNYVEGTIDLTAYIKYEESMNVNVPDNVIEGHFTKSNMQGLVFNPEYNLIEGRKPSSYEEIVISKGIVSQLKMDNSINKYVYISFPLKEELLPNGYLSRDYQIVELKIVGVSDSNKLEISNKEEWSLMFFQTMLGVSSFELSISALACSVKDNMEEEVMKSLERRFPNFETSSPISEVKDSINTVCGYIEKILLILSISSIIIASLLLAICNYLHFMEIKKDIGLIRCIGITKNEANKFIYAHSFLMAGLSFVLSSIQLLVVCYFLSRSFSSIFYIEATFIFNPLSVIYMLLVAFSISLISSLFIQKKVKNLNPIDCLR